jgi:hypothetical protein
MAGSSDKEAPQWSPARRPPEGSTPPRCASLRPPDQALHPFPPSGPPGGQDANNGILLRELLVDLRHSICGGGELLGHEYAKAVSRWRARSLDRRHWLHLPVE